MNKMVGLIQVFQILIHTPEICLDRCHSHANGQQLLQNRAYIAITTNYTKSPA
jgi:endonuclease IV